MREFQMSAVDEIRSFNRFYTRKFGLLNEGLLQSELTLTESRVLFEIANGDDEITATEIGDFLAMDAGYLSRILRRFERDGLVERRPSPSDRRQSHLILTQAGRSVFAKLDQASSEQAAGIISNLPGIKAKALTAAMSVIRDILEPSSRGEEVHLRDLEVGDLGWITHRQALLYHQEYGWDLNYEALVAEILATFAVSRNPVRERAWIAERAGEIVGSVFLVDGGDGIGKLRLLYVEPSARGLGLGRKLVDACVSFARIVGYDRVTLWTQSVLDHARKIYAATGFECTGSEPHHSFGCDLVGETWTLSLRGMQPVD
jgi:DNA-binding MarR family transcriptional regulator/GNAT superfamily N-acetyltransferase